MLERRDDPDAHDVVVLRDIPEPALLVCGLKHERGPFVATLVPIRAFPVRPDGALVQHRIPKPELEAVLQKRLLSARIHDDLGVNLAVASLLVAYGDADRSIVVE